MKIDTYRAIRKVATLDQKYFTLAADLRGQLYAVSFMGDFCKIDKTTGAKDSGRPHGILSEFPVDGIRPRTWCAVLGGDRACAQLLGYKLKYRRHSIATIDPVTVRPPAGCQIARCSLPACMRAVYGGSRQRSASGGEPDSDICSGRQAHGHCQLDQPAEYFQRGADRSRRSQSGKLCATAQL